MQVCEYVDQCINNLGIEKIFGVPGSLVMPIWQAITKAELVLCGHEQEASYLATGYAKAARKPVAVITTGGPGVTNCISGIASANIDSIPLVYISGRTPLYENGEGVRQEESHHNRMYDSTDILSNFTKKSVCVTDVESAVDIISNTFNLCVSGRMGAVHLSIPVDIQKREIVGNVSFKKNIDESSLPTSILIKDKALFVIGWGAWMSNSVGEIYELAELVNAPVLVTSKAYCCIKQASPVYLGKLGYGNNRFINEFITWYQPSSIISFGTSLGKKDLEGSILTEYVNKIDTYFVTNEMVYRSRKCNHYEVYCNDIKKYVSKLKDNVVLHIKDNGIINEIAKTRACVNSSWSEKIDLEDNMAKAISILGNLENDNVIYTADAGNHLANSAVLINPQYYGGFFLDVGLRAMGTGICSTVGMALADSSKTYVAITGDGCMLMNGNVMHVAKERNLPIVFLIFNNRSLGRVRVGQSIMNDYRATDIINVDFQHYGSTFGLKTYLFEEINEFEMNIGAIIAKRETCLVEVVTGRDEIPIIVKGNIT